MQEEKYTAFDQSIRSIMCEEHENVPLRVRINVFRQMYWARAAVSALALAGCCALALLFFLPASTVTHANKILSLQYDRQPQLSLAMLEAPKAIPQSVIRLQSSPEENTPKPQAVTESKQPNVIIAEQPQQPQQNTSAQWSIVEREEAIVKSREATKTILSAHGSLGANDSRFYATTVLPSYASGAKAGELQENSVSSYAIPFTAGVGVAFQVAPRLYVGTGVNWTMLSRTFEGAYKTEVGTMTHRLHYVGIPVNIYWSVLESNRLQFYVYGGAQAEKCISNKYYILSSSPAALYSTDVQPLAWSVAAGIGVEYAITDKLGLYFDPCARYFFDCAQPTSLRTSKPLNLGLEAGLRFSL